MFTHNPVMYSAVADGLTFIYEDVKTGIVFTTEGSLPDSDEVEHVEAFHAGKLCPIWRRTGVTACSKELTYGSDYFPCHDAGLAGKW